MVSVADIFQHIAEDLRQYQSVDPGATIEEFLTGSEFDFHLAITTDVEETEFDFVNRYGVGHSFFFRLADYEHGKLLAGQMYWILLGHRPDMTDYTGAHFQPGDRLYLFVHLRNIVPPPPVA